MSGSSSFPSISIFSQSEKVGTLAFIESGKCTFLYDDFWKANRFPISPCIPFDTELSSQTVINFLRNLFPEGDAFDLLLASQNLSKNNLYAILITIGMDTAGILSFSDIKYQEEETILREVKEQELIQKLSSNNIQALITWDGKYRLSVGGVQNKLNVLINSNNKFMLANGNYSSTHILKFASQKYKTIVVNELFCMKLAKKVGLKVANVSYRKLGEHDTLIVERFDRKITPTRVKKRHIIDACQALDMPPEYKYEHNFGGEHVQHIRDGVSFNKIYEFAKTCSVPATAIQSLIDWMIFNLIIGNSDAHGKNVSFFVGASGITITPFYDLVSVTYEATKNQKIDTSLAMAIGDNFNITSITAYDLLSLADEAGISFSFLKKRTANLSTLIIKTIDNINFDEFTLDKLSLLIIKELKALVTQQANDLFDETLEMDSVAKHAF
ncbi:HipA domain-containing protein [Colwellia sp. MSW7]|uniref:HipA domain-containing protein n=1 Tax=Colwellia maritima TaxID=2912588 RepID=A0ABS9WXZ7_9GAMM|nr:HipA domain-containing protein [Colwellia maritima]MCI2282705.1 HipA domain-containing protein [Colwellia maritima]